MTETEDPDLHRIVLIQIRLLVGWNQEDLAAAAGVDPSVVSRYESGERALPYPALEKLAAAAGASSPLLERLIAVNAAARRAISAAGAPGALAAAGEDLAAELGHRFAETGTAMARSILAGLPPLAGEHDRAAPPPSAADRETGEELWAALEGSPATGRLLVEATREYRHWALCRRVCDESFRTAAGDPDQALELADLARLIAERVPGEEPWRWRLQGYSWAHVANARSRQGLLPEADLALSRAKTLWQAGEPGDPGRLLDEARMLDLEAGLQRR